MQVLDGGIAHIAEGGDKLLSMVVDIESQCMSVSVEVAAVGSLVVPPNHSGAGIDIGIEPSVHVVLTLGCLHLVAESHPVFSRADREIEWCYIFSDRRCTTLHIHLHLIVYTRTCHLYHLVALLTLLLGEFYGLYVHGIAFLIKHSDAHHHLGAVVPYGVVPVGILP